MKLVGESFAGMATAATRVIELYVPEKQRLFDDPYALSLLPAGWQILLRLAYLPGLRQVLLSLRERRMPGSLGAILCRTRYIDDVLKRSLAAGLEQVAIFGAGFDSRAYRIDGMDQVHVFEIDLPGSIAMKQKRLGKVLGRLPKFVTYIGLDFDHQSLGAALREAGFRPDRTTLFIWEGVTQYLTAEAVDDTLRTVASSAAQGSAIVFTYVRRGLIDGSERPEWFQPLLSIASRLGSPMVFGLKPDDLEPYLVERGFELCEDVGAADYQRRYLQPLGRQLNVFDGERAAYAAVQTSAA
ncbi:MAG: SAM-dependent methyltransferase [Anaerolineales bacterium]